MTDWTSALCLTLLHSFWQSALILGGYKLFVTFFPKTHPGDKRNLLHLLVFFQLLMSVFTYWLLIQQHSVSFMPEMIGTYNKIQFDTLLVSVYFTLVSVRLFRTAFQWHQWKKAILPLEKVPAALKYSLQRQSALFGIKRKIIIAASAGIDAPVTYGFFKPVILFPLALLNHISIRDAEMIIVHELTHIRYKDFLLNVCLVITEHIYFFNPFLKKLIQYIRTEREVHCDLEVIAQHYPAVEYAEALLKTAGFKKYATAGIHAVSNKKELLYRIRLFANHNLTQKRNNLFPAFIFLPVFLAVLNLVVLNHPPQKQQSVSRTIINSPTTPTLTEPAYLNFETDLVESRVDVEAVEKTVPNLVQQQIKTEPEVAQIQTEEIIVHVQDSLSSNSLGEVAYVQVAEKTLPSRLVTVSELDLTTGKYLIQLYRFVYINDKWVAIPEWQFETMHTDSTPIPAQVHELDFDVQ